MPALSFEMTVQRILSDLRNAGIDITCYGEHLRLTGKVEKLNPELRGLILGHKAAIRQHLAQAYTETYTPSNGQARLAFIDRLNPDSPAYIVAASIRIEGELDLDCLSRSLCTTAAAHAALRTHLKRDGDLMRSVVATPSEILLPEEDLRTWTRAKTEARARTLRRTIVSEPFDLTEFPLWRWRLVRHSDDVVELIVAIHHFVADGWSLAQALRQAATGYSRLLRGAPLDIRAPQISYADFARYQQNLADAPERPARLERIKALLADAAHYLPFPRDRNRPSRKCDRGEMIAFSPPPQDCANLRAFAAKRHLTIGTVLSALHALTLSRFSGAEHFLVGMAASDRPSSAFHNTFGFFVNWLPLPVDARGDPSFENFLTRIRQARATLLDLRDIPFDEIVRHAGVTRQDNAHPLFQHMMVAHVPARRIDFANARATLCPLSTDTSKLDMTLFFTDTRNALTVRGESDIFLQVEYSKELYDRASVNSFISAFRHLLTAALTSPDTPISALPMTGGAPPAAAIGPKTAAVGTSVINAIVEQARLRPGAVAVRDDASALSYAALVDSASRLATALGLAGVKPGDRVALDHRRGGASLIALLGIMMARAVLVPLAHGVPVARLRHMINQAAPRIILTTDADNANNQDWLGAFNARNVLHLEALLASAPGADELAGTIAAIRADDPAYLLFTSGSSGQPKGVIVAHGALSNFCIWLIDELKLTPDDICLSKTDFAFDASFRETLAPLATGATVRIVPDAKALDPAALAQTIAASGTTVLHGTPTIYRDILQAPPKELALLRAVMLGGEVLDSELASAHFASAPKARLCNVYGPTECTIDVTCATVDPARIDMAPNIGRPIANTTVFIAGADMEPLPQGKTGEIVIGGQALAQGYLDPTQDDGRFVPATATKGLGRLFRTGDRGRLRGDGTLEFLGRADRQVKVRGARVELDEIEAVLAAHPGIASAAAILATDTKLSVYLQPRDWPARQDLETRIATHLVDHLPPYMRPARIFLRSALPLQHGGKTDYAALSCLDDIDTPQPPNRPMNRAEARIATFMAPYLEEPVSGPQSDFFALGGHSLNAMRVLTQINAEFGVTLSIKTFFADATVRGLAEQVATAAVTQPAAAAPAIRRAKRPRGAIYE